jgi:TRAP-type C4-dicarboxylate transport system permease large subunit
MIYTIIIGATLFGYFVAVSQAPQEMVAAVAQSGLGVPLIMLLLMGVYLVLGAVFDEVAAMVITLPFVLPLIKSWGFDPVWWGIVNVVLVELGMLTPPLGMNVFVIHGIARDVPLAATYRGVVPYIASDLVRLGLLLALPGLALWLPNVMKG